jgi:hypothetical protein
MKSSAWFDGLIGAAFLSRVPDRADATPWAGCPGRPQEKGTAARHQGKACHDQTATFFGLQPATAGLPFLLTRIDAMEGDSMTQPVSPGRLQGAPTVPTARTNTFFMRFLFAAALRFKTSSPCWTGL